MRTPHRAQARHQHVQPPYGQPTATKVNNNQAKLQLRNLQPHVLVTIIETKEGNGNERQFLQHVVVTPSRAEIQPGRSSSSINHSSDTRIVKYTAALHSIVTALSTVCE